MPRHYSSGDDSGGLESYSSDESNDDDSGGLESYSSDESSEETHSYSSRYQRKRSTKPQKRKFQNKNFTPQKRRNQGPSSSQQAGVYVTRNNETSVCYVGKSENIPVRINQHMQESRNIRREGTITHGSTSDLESWERNEVLTRMYRTGMDSVRGWRYTRKGPLSMDERISARNDIMEKFDLCRRCGHNNHFADKCFARSPAFWCKDIPMQ